MDAEARAEAIEVMARAIYRSCNATPEFDALDPITQDNFRQMANAAYDKLFSPRVVPCSECGGRGEVPNRARNVDDSGLDIGRRFPLLLPCPAGCDHGQVSLPPLAVLMGCPHRWCVGCQAYTVTTWTAEGPMCEAEHHGDRPFPQGGAAPNCPACSREEEGT